MSHSHDFHHQPYEDGFDGLGLTEKDSVSEEENVAQTIYYTLTHCSERNCPVEEYRSWLFNTQTFSLCCEDVLAEEPSESFSPQFKDFKGDDEPIVVEFTCRHCGDVQKVESDYIYSKEN